MPLSMNWVDALVAMIEGGTLLYKVNMWRLLPVLCRRTNDACKRVLQGMLPYQRGHCINIINTLRLHSRCLDTSVMGSGKTYTACFVAKQLNVDLVVFGPPLTRNGWADAARHIGITDRLEFHSYSEFQRKAKPYLAEITIGDEKRYTATTEWTDRITTRSTLLAFDESHNLKNNTMRTSCAVALSQSVIDAGGKVLLLTATPYDKVEQIVNVARLLVIVRRSPLIMHIPATGQRIMIGMADLIHYCTRLTGEPIRYNEHGSADKLTKTLVTKHIKPRLFVEMKPPPKLYNASVANYFCRVESQNSIELLRDGVNRLHAGISMTQSADPAVRAAALGVITQALQMIEKGKVEIFVRIAYNKLTTDLSSKVIIMLNYIEPLKEIQAHLGWINPLVIYGQTKQADRDAALAKFQSQSLAHRLLITNVNMTSTGINLDDREGDRPRLMLVSPSYKTINLHQAIGRTDRVTTRSEPVSKYIYARDTSTELRLLDSLAKKSAVIRSSLQGRVKFPGDHDVEYE